MKLNKAPHKITISLLLTLSFFGFTTVNNELQAQENFTVVLDAGHGGKDPGRPAKNYSEKDIALNVVLLTGKYLKQNNKQIKVVYTRDKDVFVELKQRGKIANDADANLFVSVHCNAHHTQAYGTETYVLGLHANKQNFEVAKHENSVIFLEDNYQEKYEGFDPNSPEAVIGMTMIMEDYLDESLMVASYIQNNFTNNLKRKSRGVKQAGFVVLHQTFMPSVLIETGFISNKSEGEFLNSKSGQEKVSKEIANAILKYKKHLDENRVVDIQKEIPDVKAEKVVYFGINFKVQIATGRRKLALKSYNFKGLEGVEREKVGSMYRYYYGKTSSYEEIKKIQLKAKKQGYPSAFLVAFKNGEKVDVSEVLKEGKGN
ncbi:MAG: N-acetylmuramoyl-L-alanine amidase [Bacteroidota bacterium]